MTAATRTDDSMARHLYVNLPVKDLQRSIAFFGALGFTFNPMFTDENATCMVVNDATSVMLLAEPFFATFTRKPISDAHAATETLLALSLPSREAVDAFVATALANGATEYAEPRDMGFMYQRGIADPDGHQWEPFFMDEAQFPGT